MTALDTYVFHAEGRTKGAPLVFAFHGTGGTETQLVPLVRELMRDVTIIAPRGDVEENGALRFFRRESAGRYDMADLARRTTAMGDFIEAHVHALAPTKVIGLGYSNGANILASVIFARPDLFERAVLLHPLIPWAPDPAPVRTRVLITAGERDPICPPAATEALEAWFREQGAPVETHWHAGGHEIDRSEITALARFLR